MPSKTRWDGKSVKTSARGRAGSSHQVQAGIRQHSGILQDKRLPSRVGQCRSGFRHQILSNSRDLDGQSGIVRVGGECTPMGIKFDFLKLKDNRSMNFKDDTVRYYKTRADT